MLVENIVFNKIFFFFLFNIYIYNILIVNYYNFSNVFEFIFFIDINIFYLFDNGEVRLLFRFL